MTEKQYEIICHAWDHDPTQRFTINDLVVLLDSQLMIYNLSDFFNE